MVDLSIVFCKPLPEGIISIQNSPWFNCSSKKNIDCGNWIGNSYAPAIRNMQGTDTGFQNHNLNSIWSCSQMAIKRISRVIFITITITICMTIWSWYYIIIYIYTYLTIINICIDSTCWTYGWIHLWIDLLPVCRKAGWIPRVVLVAPAAWFLSSRVLSYPKGGECHRVSEFVQFESYQVVLIPTRFSAIHLIFHLTWSMG